MRWTLACLLLGSVACSTANDAADAVTTTALAAENPSSELIAKLRAAYERTGDESFLDDLRDVHWMDLHGEAREAFNYYAGAGGIALVGEPIAKVGLFEGRRITFVAGDVSDTGSEWGFYDEDGRALAIAYGGQGENPGAGGVDWVK